MEMIERVARTLCKSSGNDPDAMIERHPRLESRMNTPLGDRYAEHKFGEGVGVFRHRQDLVPAWNFWVDQARDVVDAMREPTEAMMKAAFRANRTNTDATGVYLAKWEAAIDEALNPADA